MGDLFHEAVSWAAYVVAALLCVLGIGISVFSLSGTWLVVAAAVLTRLAVGAPGWLEVGLFILVAGVVEIFDSLAGAWGVRRRGGSAFTGLAAIGGGIAGMVIGSLGPFPVVGTLLGMLTGGFVAAYVVEWLRHGMNARALHVARGVLVGRLMVLVMKTGASLGMTILLVLGLAGE